VLASLVAAAGCSHGNPGVATTIHHVDPRLSVVSVNTLPTTIGPVVDGEIRNTSNGPVQLVQIAVSLTDTSGKDIGSQFGFTLLKVIPPGTKAAFSIPYTGGRRSVGKVSATVTAAAAPPTGYTTVQVATKQGSVLGTDYQVTGTVSNSTSGPVHFVNIVGTFYDAKGHVVGAAQDESDASAVPPGGTTSFNLILQEQGTKVSTYALAAEAQVVPPGQ
jgi:hypothetical protein